MHSKRNQPTVSNEQIAGYLRSLKDWHWPCLIIDPGMTVIVHDPTTGGDGTTIRKFKDLEEFQQESNRVLIAAR